MPRTADEIFEDDEFARLYDAFNPWGAGDQFYFDLARKAGGPILDLGCGTGMLAARIAAEMPAVTGVDPAAGMLRVARSRPGAEKVEWIRGDARNLELEQRFNLIYLTGHASQVFLSDGDALLVLKSAARHLAADGLLAFEARNPEAKAWLSWTTKKTRKMARVPGLGRVEETTDCRYDPSSGIAELTHRYLPLETGGEMTGRSRIRFVSQNHLAKLIAAAGLSPLAWYGDWDRRPWSPAAPEIIVIAALH